MAFSAAENALQDLDLSGKAGNLAEDITSLSELVKNAISLIRVGVLLFLPESSAQGLRSFTVFRGAKSRSLQFLEHVIARFETAGR